MALNELFDPSISRLVLTVGLVLAGVLAYRLFNRWTLARLQAQGPGLAKHGSVTLVYFTTPTCAPCKTVQRPAIRRLQEQVGPQLQVVEIDAAQQPEVAGEWGVMSVPTTFVLDTAGQPVHVNHGVTPADKLFQQVEKLLPKE
jgi:thiol-disulfide isomerase/thioredoxin